MKSIDPANTSTTSDPCIRQTLQPDSVPTMQSPASCSVAQQPDCEQRKKHNNNRLLCCEEEEEEEGSCMELDNNDDQDSTRACKPSLISAFIIM